MRSRLFGLLALAALIAIALPVIVIERLAVGARDDAALSATPLTVAQAVSAITDPVPAEDWVVKSARRRSGSDPDLMGPAGAALDVGSTLHWHSSRLQQGNGGNGLPDNGGTGAGGGWQVCFA